MKTARITITQSAIAVAPACHCEIHSGRPCQAPFIGQPRLSHYLLIRDYFTRLSLSECPAQARRGTGLSCCTRSATEIHKGYDGARSRYEIFGTYSAKTSDFGKVQNFLSNRHLVCQQDSAISASPCLAIVPNLPSLPQIVCEDSRIEAKNKVQSARPASVFGAEKRDVRQVDLLCYGLTEAVVDMKHVILQGRNSILILAAEAASGSLAG